MTNKIIVFDVDRQIWRLKMAGYPILDNLNYDIEYSYDIDDRKINSNFKKILVKNWWIYPPDKLLPVTDYSWADLIICINTEVNNEPWPDYHYKAQRLLNNKNIIHLLEGKNLTCNYSDELFCSPLLYFFLITRMVNKDINVNLIELPTEKKFRFDALLGKTNWNRRFVYNSLIENNLLSTSLCFFYNNIPKFDYIVYESPELFNLEHNEILHYKKNASIHADQRHTTFLSNIIVHDGYRAPVSTIVSPKIYDNSWFSIITESTANQINFLTEKTAKCLLMKRIFILFSAPFTLNFLQQQGFKTFGNLIDESYDYITDDITRFNLAFEQVKILSKVDPYKLYKQATPTLEHNYNLLMHSSLNFNKIKKFVVDRINQL